jgi:hypothetical protein
MNAPVIVSVVAFTGCPFAVSAEDGNRLYDRIAPLMHTGAAVEVSFAGVETVIAAFLSAAIGPLCAEFSDEQMESLLTVRDLIPDNRATLERSTLNARRYYANRAAYDAAWTEETGVA